MPLISQLASPEQDRWIERVLGWRGSDSAGSKQGTERASTALLPLWRQTREALDRQIAMMQRALLGADDANYDLIAHFGFNGLTDGRNTRLMGALFDYDAAPGSASAKKVAAALDAYAELLGSDSVLDDYDANPLGVSVSFRATLTRGLSELRSAVDRHAH